MTDQESAELVTQFLARGGEVKQVPENLSGRNGNVLRTRRPSNEYLARTRAEQFFYNINKR